MKSFYHLCLIRRPWLYPLRQTTKQLFLHYSFDFKWCIQCERIFYLLLTTFIYFYDFHLLLLPDMHGFSNNELNGKGSGLTIKRSWRWILTIAELTLFTLNTIINKNIYFPPNPPCLARMTVRIQSHDLWIP